MNHSVVPIRLIAILVVVLASACKSNEVPSAPAAVAFSGWSCDTISKASTCTQWAKLSKADVELKRDNVCGVQSGVFQQKPCPRRSL